ncbi:LysE family transporter [Mesorhizobium sp. Cs1299R1N1]|uniref:LysE family translocator n=1 Tax=unclassified Mesorhizobium TaxID=325217 RepID=UPI00301C499B
MSGTSELVLSAMRGALLGFAVAAPIGPTGLLCVQRTIAGGIGPGLATGYGAATTHSVYASIAAAGLGAVAQVLMGWHMLLQLCAGIFLLYMSLTAARLTPSLDTALQRRMPSGRAYVTGLIWTLGNPMTLVGFLTLTPGILGAGMPSWKTLALVSAGVLLGSAAWWTTLTLATNHLRKRLSARGLRYVNLGFSSALLIFALSLFASALRA